MPGSRPAAATSRLLATDDGKPVPTAAVFTTNKFRAPPVDACIERLAASGGMAAGVIVNSGNANAGTGAKGRADAEAMCDAAAEAVGCDERRDAGLLDRADRLPPADAQDPGRHPDARRDAVAATAHRDAAKGILTTDTRPKEAVVDGDGYTVGGMAKGCGMLAPNMATMLAFLTTDAALEPAELQPILARAADATFNCLITDGATSTNDTVMLFASGRRGRPADLAAFEDDVRQVCEELMLQMARDAEGMTKLVVIRVTGAASDAEARQVARSIGNNQLIKCSWYGADAYWGRLLAEAGSCGVDVRHRDERRSPMAGSRSPRRGSKSRTMPRRCMAHMRGAEIDILVDLGLGDGVGPRGLGRSRPRLHQGKCGNVMIMTPNETARLLIEALPYIRRFTGKTIVVKVGGLPMTDPARARSLAKDVLLLHSVGIRPVLVHGGGPQIDEQMAQAGQDGRAHRRPARHRCRDARHRPHGAGRQDQPRAGRARSMRSSRSRSGSRARTGGCSRSSRSTRGSASSARSARCAPACSTPCSTTGWCRSSRPSAPTPTGQPYNVNADDAARAIAVAMGAEKTHLSDRRAGPARRPGRPGQPGPPPDHRRSAARGSPMRA